MRLRVILVMLLVWGMLLTTASAAPVKFDESSIFELETVSLSELHENPGIYDATIAYRKISVVGTFSELGKQSTTITQDPYSLRIDPIQESLFTGFSVGDDVKITGEFRYDPIEKDVFIPTYVMHYPLEYLGEVEVSEILNNIDSYNGRFVTIIGNLTTLEESMGRYFAYVRDPSTGDELKVMFYGDTSLEAGTIVEVSGLFNGGILHSENMVKYQPPFSLKTLIPGFSAMMTIALLGILAILFKYEKHNG
ncbi:MAG: hypothetical protein JXA98_01010 [Methanosarcinaceae archaeon]|nr:hypothetical protein [Methanosarcinaceae archaeon]